MCDEGHEQATHGAEEVVARCRHVAQDGHLFHAQVDDIVRRDGAVAEEQLEQFVDVLQYPACARSVAGALREPAVDGGEYQRDDVYALLVRQVRVCALTTEQPEAVPQRRPVHLYVERVEAAQQVRRPRDRRRAVHCGPVHVDVVTQQVLEDAVDLRQHAVVVADPHAVEAPSDAVS